MEEQYRDATLPTGAGIIRIFMHSPLSWKQRIAEWIDNSFGAGARKVTIRQDKSRLEIIDDGAGCDNLVLMESLAKSNRQTGNRASMFGVGGVWAQIQATRGGRVEVVSTTTTRVSTIRINWAECLETDEIHSQLLEVPSPKSAKTGTTITMHGARKIPGVPTLVGELGHFFAGMLKGGCSIIFDIDGEKTRVKPYSHPDFSRQVELDFELDGHRITGFCGLVERGVSNPYPGFSLHWGYRFVGQFHEPARGRLTNRVYAEVCLPRSWENIGVTKDGLSDTDDAKALWDALAERCAEILDAADCESDDLDLFDITEAAEDLVNEAIRPKEKIKGARPGDTGKNGTAEPTGTGSEHKQFATSQPGNKAAKDSSGRGRLPSRLRINFDETMGPDPYLFVPNKPSVGPSQLTLNSSLPGMAALKEDSRELAIFCLLTVAREIADGSPKTKDCFLFIKDDDYKSLVKRFLSRIPIEVHE